MIEMITIKVEESFLTKASGNAGGLIEDIFGDDSPAKPGAPANAKSDFNDDFIEADSTNTVSFGKIKW